MPLGQFAVHVDAPHPFDARRVAPRFRQEALLAAFAALRVGETMRSCHEVEPAEFVESLTDLYGARLAVVHVSRDPGKIIIDAKRLPVS